MSDDTYPMPAHGWTCFHCGETFTTPGAARLHFGTTPEKTPGCILNVGVGAERGLLACLRKAEDQIARHLSDDSDAQRTMVEQAHRHSDALRIAEELGYERGLRDAAVPEEVRVLKFIRQNCKVTHWPRRLYADQIVHTAGAENGAWEKLVEEAKL